MSAPYVAVDWGTSSFRLWLLGPDGSVLAESRGDEGMTVSAATSGFPAVLAKHLAAVEAPDRLPVVICGMAGARQGWREAGYVETPAPLAALFDAAIAFEDGARAVRILPGIAQRQAGRPDVMRGEETQLAGALSTGAGGDGLICLPGTHSKWASIADGTVTGFSTFMTGETFALFSRHSILSHTIDAAADTDPQGEAFRNAVIAGFREPQRLLNALFAIRAGGLLGVSDAKDAGATLSGLLIGQEIAGALGDRPNTAVTLVASGRMARLYDSALTACGITAGIVDADAAVRAGLFAAAQRFWGPQSKDTISA
ncbi:2-dehydro-3-deoxygalactonokinase [Mangrovicella endophytica]|uniref:2-dehydro-3-deoxygalactonokinase n=1 Tax=Mangrovicella endophytica TaxID=2066697 RepID=UPI000C9E0FDF|nr:2-dehydro-3-deoxygalactonokinase [Mangrovicella endophytica]